MIFAILRVTVSTYSVNTVLGSVIIVLIENFFDDFDSFITSGKCSSAIMPASKVSFLFGKNLYSKLMNDLRKSNLFRM